MSNSDGEAREVDFRQRVGHVGQALTDLVGDNFKSVEPNIKPGRRGIEYSASVLFGPSMDPGMQECQFRSLIRVVAQVGGLRIKGSRFTAGSESKVSYNRFYISRMPDQSAAST